MDVKWTILLAPFSLLLFLWPASHFYNFSLHSFAIAGYDTAMIIEFGTVIFTIEQKRSLTSETVKLTKNDSSDTIPFWLTMKGIGPSHDLILDSPRNRLFGLYARIPFWLIFGVFSVMFGSIVLFQKSRSRNGAAEQVEDAKPDNAPS
ncbi:MAG: hypothetical protein CMO55_09115 [Verrucomicrobiales bacterium]|nr:hypothetical protein [Verrucomicrobiales bacterium]